MKTRLLFLFLLAGTLNLMAQSLVPEVLYYDFNGTGTSVPNLASNPPPGTANANIFGTISIQNNGICNGSLQGSGNSASTDYLNTGWATNLGTASWTISFRSQGISINSTLFYVFGDGQANGFRCFTNGVAGSNNFILRGGGLTDVLASGGALGIPTMTTFVYDSALANCKAYVNGVLINTIAQGAVNVAGAGPFKVMGYNTNVGAPAGGLMDDFRVYRRALNANEVMTLYTGTTGNFLGADQQLCAGDTLTLTAPGGANNSYAWSTGDTVNQISVTSPGSYSVSVSGACVQGNDTVQVTSGPALPSPGFASGDTSVCLGQMAPLSANAGTNALLWSTGDTTSSIMVGIGSYTVTSSNICGSVTDTVEVMQTMLTYSGYVMADTSLVPCEGDTVMLTSSSVFDQYLWSTGDTSNVIWVTNSGTYSLNVSDACGSGSDSVLVDFLAPVSASFSSSVSQFTGTFTSTASGGGTLNYNWTFGDGNSSTQANPSHTYAANGTYLVSLTVSNACGSVTVTDSVTILAIAIGEPLALGLELYPNPAKEQTVIKAELTQVQDLRIEMLNLQGQILFSEQHDQVSGSFSRELNTSKFAAGTYFLRVTGNEGQQTLRLVIE